MKEGDTWELAIPSNLVYGERGAGAQISTCNSYFQSRTYKSFIIKKAR